MSPVKVSIVTAAYNKAGFISDTIRSVTGQTYTELEYIIVDDASTDTTIEIVEEFRRTDPRILLLINDTNKGGNYSRNRGLFAATGAYIMFLDADDLLSVDCVENRLTCAQDYPSGNLFVFTMGVFYRKAGDDTREWRPVSKQPLKDFLSHALPWSILQPLWKRDFLDQLGGFDESFQRMQDVELNTRALLHKDINYRMIAAAPDCYYRIDEGRKIFDTALFLEKWVKSAVKYCDKFKTLVRPDLVPYLSGTIYETYLQLLYQFRIRQITKEDFSALEFELLSGTGFFKRGVFRCARVYNLFVPRIPGFNRVLKFIITR